MQVRSPDASRVPCICAASALRREAIRLKVGKTVLDETLRGTAKGIEPFSNDATR
jgi:hypothetical protein